MTDTEHMTDDRQLDGVENALVELRAAEEAGVFEATKVNAALLASTPAPLSRLQVRAIIGTVAAAIFLAFGVGSWMYSGELASLRERSQVALATSHEPCDGSFYNCMSGPKGAMPGECDVHDYDHDGDVDVADYGQYQLACVTPMGFIGNH